MLMETKSKTFSQKHHFCVEGTLVTFTKTKEKIKVNFITDSL